MSNEEMSIAVELSDRAPSDELFRLELVLTRLLRAAAAGDRERAAKDFAIVARLYPTSRSLRVLERVAHGERRVLQTEDFFLVGADDVGADIWERAERDGRAACAAARELVGHLPIVVLELVASAPPLALLSADIPGFRHLLLAGAQLAAPNFTAALFHEIGHAVLTCGCRFLDEGWAVFFSYRGDAEHAFPLPRRKLAGFIDEHRSDLIDLHALLGLPAVDDLTFDGVARNEPQRRLIYAEAYLLIDKIVRSFGVAKLLALFAAIRESADPSSTPLILARTLDQTVARLQAECLPVQGWDGRTMPLPSYDCLHRSLTHAEDRDQALTAAIAALRRLLAEPSGAEPAMLALTALLLLKLGGADPKQARLLRSEIEALLIALEASGETSAEFDLISERYVAIAAATAVQPVEQAIWQFRMAQARGDRAAGAVKDDAVGKICGWALAATG